ncbi:MAG: hypothetical protein ACI4XB_07240 [Ruminococcus sp.]
MLQMIKGCQVPFPEKLFEQYELTSYGMAANIGADRLKAFFQFFISQHKEPLFLILELPTNWNDEEKNENGEVEVPHKDIYYIDGCTREEALAILSRAGDRMIHDGLCEFGFGAHETHEEMMLRKYNLVTVCVKDTMPYQSYLESKGIMQTECLVTAWDTFSEEFPGVCERYYSNGKDVYSILKEFKDWGIYFAERREQ